ncbi:MAG: hypothetical protein DRP00_01315 [Candidatus Aenigmatarchaeota archaeon]|nr:MAG: hypothetical protein DRP00_01315 [Candidatus Aenigmarchaeota archaeon]
MVDDVEAVVRELERLQREQARIRAVLEKYQKIEEERKALLKRVEGEINEAKKKAKRVGVDIDRVLEEINTLITTDDKLIMPALSSEDYETLLDLEKSQMDGGAGELIKRIAAFARREIAKRKIISELQKLREAEAVNFPPADTVFRVFNEIASVIIEKGEEITPDDIENIVKKVTRRTAIAARANGVRRTRRTGVKAFLRKLLEERGEVSITEAVDELLAAGLAESEEDAKRKFNSAQYSIVHTDGDAEYINGVLRLIPE